MRGTTTNEREKTMKKAIIVFVAVCLMAGNVLAAQKSVHVDANYLARKMYTNPVELYEEFKGKVVRISGYVTDIGFASDGHPYMMLNSKTQIAGESKDIGGYSVGERVQVKTILGGLTVGGKPYFVIAPKTEEDIEQEKQEKIEAEKIAKENAERAKAKEEFDNEARKIKMEISREKRDEFKVAMARISDELVTPDDTQRHGFTRSPYEARYRRMMTTVLTYVVGKIAEDVNNGVPKEETLSDIDRKLKAAFKSSIEKGVSQEFYGYISEYTTKYNSIDVGEFTPAKAPGKLTSIIIDDAKKEYSELYHIACKAQKQKDRIVGFLLGKTAIDKYIEELKAN